MVHLTLSHSHVNEELQATNIKKEGITLKPEEGNGTQSFEMTKRQETVFQEDNNFTTN